MAEFEFFSHIPNLSNAAIRANPKHPGLPQQQGTCCEHRPIRVLRRPKDADATLGAQANAANCAPSTSSGIGAANRLATTKAPAQAEGRTGPEERQRAGNWCNRADDHGTGNWI